MAWVVLVREKNGEWRDWFATRWEYQPYPELPEQWMANSIERFIHEHFRELEARVMTKNLMASFCARQKSKAVGAGR